MRWVSPLALPNLQKLPCGDRLRRRGLIQFSVYRLTIWVEFAILYHLAAGQMFASYVTRTCCSGLKQRNGVFTIKS